ncbi:rhomboid family intramembrane serine protease [Pseudomonas muyukensis]|uniref:Rhomboid family intramembrane serine protease n=1 Tax=Pseudomonas muyukensis TaxID=2842357 RepID=A0ABX8M5W1_9PSED|nr:rhomboid family intramembrane serine protease [Pseudomonas muyukensis]QXH34370.1 rhomboid family intramembrane serine protease [Pseudomonas muyukensis]
MTPVAALRLGREVDLQGFLDLLARLDIRHQVSEEEGQHVLWVDEALAERVRGLYQRFPEGEAEVRRRRGSVMVVERRPPLAEQLRAAKMTLFVLIASLLVAAITALGANLATLGWFTFLQFEVQGDYLYFTSLAQEMAEGQWWRLVSPMLVHFGWLHLLMNALWYWELGRRVERRQGPWPLLALTLLFALVSNLAQHFTSGPSLFGGLSGVLYGLLGHVWLYQRLAPDKVYRLPPGTVGSLLIWLLVCLSGLITLLGFGQIANAAHVGGLLIGCLTGLLGGALARRRLSA